MRRLIFALLSVVLTLVPIAASAQTPAQWDYSRVNYYRHHYGRRALTVKSALQSRAQAWAKNMAVHDNLHDDINGQSVCWHFGGHYYGSNVGYGPTVKDIEYTLERSAPHRSNILDRHYRWIGVGVVTYHGTVWLAQAFCG